MSHSVNLQSLLEDLVLLEHFAYGSEEFCKSNGITSFEETGYMEPLSPRTLLRGVVCDKLISVAIKTRIILDHASVDKVGLNRIESQATIGLQLTAGSSPLTVRESLNKIIHALQVSIDFVVDEYEPSNTHYWDGRVLLEGTQNGKAWSYHLKVCDWVKAVRRALMQLIREERLGMLGWDGGL